LVFLTGQSEIEYACRSVLDLNDEIDYDQGQNDQEPGPMGVLDKTVRGLSVLPLYASLDPREQRKVFEPIRQQGRRKIVFSTNIAATSVTIPNIRYVVDCGFVKQKEYDARLDMDGLLVTRISKAAADQRAGRAGRTMHGVCWRLYSSEEYEQFPDGTCPEVQRTSLTSTVLTLKSLGVQNILSFPFMDSPEQESIMTAGKRLYLISALSETGELTNKGEIVSKFPISPALAVALITSSTPEFHCSREMATICAVLSSEDIYEKNLRRSDDVQGAASVRSKWAHRSGDHLTLLNIVLAFKMASSISKDEAKSFCYRNYLRLKSLWNCLDIESQLLALMQKLSIPINTSSNSAAALKYINRNDGVPFEKSFNFDFVDAERIQYRKILKALLHSFYGNLARKSQTSTEAGSHTLFYHYASTLAPASNSSNYLALSLDQNSSLISNVRDLEWVFFNDISYTNRATMRICSRVFFDYVPSELIDRLKNNQSRQFMEQLVGDSGQLAEKRMLEQKQAAHAETNLDVKDHDSVIETIKKRAVDENAVEDARQRYLERKKRQRN
jgi:HrpA-like RNA helicase